MTTPHSVGRCPACGAAVYSQHTLIEYRTAAGQPRSFAECPACTRVDHPTLSMHTDDSHPEDHPPGTLSWAVDDEADPSELTIFEPQAELTTHWITMDTESVCDLDQRV